MGDAIQHLQAARSMLVDEWKTSAFENPPACASISAIGRKIDDALSSMGVNIDKEGVPW